MFSLTSSMKTKVVQLEHVKPSVVKGDGIKYVLKQSCRFCRARRHDISWQ